MFKLTEVKYTRVFNLGDYEKEEMACTITSDEDAGLDAFAEEIQKVQVRFHQISIPYKKAQAERKRKAEAQAQGGK